MNSLEIFSGMGGLAKGLELSGVNHAHFVEFDKHACNSLRQNFAPEIVFEGDIRKFQFSELGQIDVVAGGPPCQPFSMGGKHQAVDDNRDMFPPAIDAIAALRPKLFIFENVKGLLRASFREYFDFIIKRLEFAGVIDRTKNWQDDHHNLCKLSEIHKQYEVIYKLINAANYGVPQCRERVFIVGIRKDLGVKPSFPEETHSKVSLLQQQAITSKYWDRHKIAPEENYMNSLAKIQPLLIEDKMLPWVTVRDAISHLPDPRTDHGITDHDFRDGARSYPGHTGSYIDLPAKTIKAGVHGVPGGENMIRYSDGSIRYFTIQEAKLIQTFPENFQIAGAWGEAMRQIGNAVPVKLANTISTHMLRLLGK